MDPWRVSWTEATRAGGVGMMATDHVRHRAMVPRAGQRVASIRSEAADLRRGDLIEATITTIARFGFHGASIEQISAEAGVSRGLVRHHFGSKAGLLEETYRHLIKEFQCRLEESLGGRDPGPETVLDLWFWTVFQPPYFRPDYLAAWFAFGQVARTEPGLMTVNREIYAWYRRFLTPLFERMAARDGATLEPALAVDGLVALMDGLWLELLVDPVSFEPSRAILICRDYVARLRSPVSSRHHLRGHLP